MTREPLPPGTKIKYIDLIATVVSDDGGHSFLVEHDGKLSTWKWTLWGRTCEIVEQQAQDSDD